MAKYTSPVCVFVDCTIPMSLLFQKELVFGKKTEHFLNTLRNRLHIPCYISSSVNKMNRDKIKEISDKIGNVLSDFKQWLIHSKVIKYGRKYLTSRDVLDFQMFFTRKMRMYELDERVKEEIRAIEIWIFDKAMDLLRKSKGKIDVAEFLKALFDFHDQSFRQKIAELDGYELRHKYWELKNIEPIDEIKELVEKSVFDSEDVPHLASTIQYQFKENVWVMFVSLDFRDIVGHKIDLFNKFAITVCDPLYFELEYKNIIATHGTQRPLLYISQFPEKHLIVGSILKWLK